jgi:hypothetical protein
MHMHHANTLVHIDWPNRSRIYSALTCKLDNLTAQLGQNMCRNLDAVHGLVLNQGDQLKASLFSRSFLCSGLASCQVVLVSAPFSFAFRHTSKFDIFLFPMPSQACSMSIQVAAVHLKGG